MRLDFDKIILIIAFIWYCATAWFSSGYYHADEHYQLIEFSGIKLGTHTADDLAWEYKAEIRPTFQPSICYVVIRILKTMSINNPYYQAFALRLITALLALSCIWFFITSCKELISPKYWKTTLLLSFFIWYLPFINVRFSSETWAGLLLLPALGLILRKEDNLAKFIIIGLFFGLSFLFRFQMLTAEFGLLLWLLVIRKEKTATIFLLISSMIIVIALGILIDFWFYNKPVFTAWNYFYVNLVEGVSSSFGTSPWYFYIYYVFRFSFFPFGIITLLSFFFLLFKRPKTIFLWAIIPFLLIHSIIPHKELRFLFPIINLVPILLVLTFQEIEKYHQTKIVNKIIIFFVSALVIINLFALSVASFLPQESGRMRIAQTIFDEKSSKPTHLIHFNGSNPYDPWGGLKAKFYMENRMIDTKLKSLDQLPDSLIKTTYSNRLILKRGDAENKNVRDFIERMNFVKVRESYPKWMVFFLSLYGGFKKDEVLVLYSQNCSS